MPELEQRKIIQEAVHETLLRLGLNIDEPHEMQADMIFLRKSRRGNEEVSKWTRRTAVGVFMSSLLYALWEGVKHLVRG